ncbi:MAG: beta-lactamase family protein [Pseudomonadota bacterium]|nr:beta-lactamase family protein [Pseudomonadota bacterium]
MSEIDQVLRTAAETGEVPGVVGIAGTTDRVIYQGAFGRRSLPDGPAMSLDTVFRIASMTKAITAAAAMQLVEQGRLALDQPAAEVVPGLAAPLVLEGFDDAGRPRLRPAKRPVTLRHLLTHTAGFGYDIWSADLLRYHLTTGLPAPRTGKLAGLTAPLTFDPGERWQYGINIDWVGRMVEAVSGDDLETYLREHIFAPLGMTDTGFVVRADMQARLATTHARMPAGFDPQDSEVNPPREFFNGGGGLHSTAHDYMRFQRMLLRSGMLDGARVLKPETVALMAQNHMGEIEVEPMRSFVPASSCDVEFFPGTRKTWGLSFLINTEAVPGGRSAGSLAWAGLYNSYFWIDPTKEVAGALFTQILPFGDAAVLRLLEAFERAVYPRTERLSLVIASSAPVAATGFSAKGVTGFGAAIGLAPEIAVAPGLPRQGR